MFDRFLTSKLNFFCGTIRIPLPCLSFARSALWTVHMYGPQGGVWIVQMVHKGGCEPYTYFGDKFYTILQNIAQIFDFFSKYAKYSHSFCLT